MFCEHCGKELKNNEACTCQDSKDNLKKVNGNKKAPKSLIMIGAVVVVILIAAIALFSSKTEQINLADYIDVQPKITGLNGKAKIKMSALFDDNALESYLLEGMGDKDSKDVENMSDEDFEALLMSAGEGFLECEQAVKDIELTVWKNGTEVLELIDLSNGDTIKVQASSVNPVNKYLDKNFKTGSAEFKIEGLLDGQTLDVFADVDMQVNFVGTNGNGQAILNWNREAFPELSIDFHVEDTTAFSNGDEVTVVLDYDSEQWELNGYMPAEESKTYIVDGLQGMLTAIEDISEEQLEEMKANVEKFLKEEAENEWRDGISIEGMTYLGSYLLNKKEGDMGLGAPNILYLVYKVDAFENFASAGGEDTHFSYYYCASYEGLMMNEEGKVDLETAYFNQCWDSFSRDVCMGSSMMLYSVMVDYDGFETLEELFETCVENYSDQYYYASTIEM